MIIPRRASGLLLGIFKSASFECSTANMLSMKCCNECWYKKLICDIESSVKKMRDVMFERGRY